MISCEPAINLTSWQPHCCSIVDGILSGAQERGFTRFGRHPGGASLAIVEVEKGEVGWEEACDTSSALTPGAPLRSGLAHADWGSSSRSEGVCNIPMSPAVLRGHKGQCETVRAIDWVAVGRLSGQAMDLRQRQRRMSLRQRQRGQTGKALGHTLTFTRSVGEAMLMPKAPVVSPAAILIKRGGSPLKSFPVYILRT